MTDLFHNPVINPLHHKKTMANNTLDKAIEAIPNFGKRIKLFTEKLRIAQYADNSIYDYRLKIAQAVLFFRVLSQEQIARLIRNCSLYDKTLLAIIYDCALRVGEACRLRWDDICFDRKKLFVFQGKGRKDRDVPISDQMLVVLKAYSHLATGMHCATYRSSSMCRIVP